MSIPLGNKIRGYGRLGLIVVVTLIFFILVTILRYLPMKSRPKYNWAQSLRKAWSKICLLILNFRVKYLGEVPRDRNYLFVGNHRSSLDPFVFLARHRANPVSRADVRNYPLVGKGAELSGIIFVDKESRTSRSATKQAIYDALSSGKSVMIYPEGRTGSQELTATFQKGSYEVAAELNIPIVPFVIEYKDPRANWDHTESMLVHYLKYLSNHRTDIIMKAGPVMQSDNAWSLLRQSQQWINEEIPKIRSTWEG